MNFFKDIKLNKLVAIALLLGGAACHHQSSESLAVTTPDDPNISNTITWLEMEPNNRPYQSNHLGVFEVPDLANITGECKIGDRDCFFFGSLSSMALDIEIACDEEVIPTVQLWHFDSGLGIFVMNWLVEGIKGELSVKNIIATHEFDSGFIICVTTDDETEYGMGVRAKRYMP